jgi:hypothetical protein
MRRPTGRSPRAPTIGVRRGGWPGSHYKLKYAGCPSGRRARRRPDDGRWRVCSVENLRCSAPVRIARCHAARLTLKGSRAVATGGASRRSGTRNPWEGVSFVVFAPEGRWTAILRPAGAGGSRGHCSTGSVRLWRTPPVATALGPVGAEHGRFSTEHDACYFTTESVK